MTSGPKRQPVMLIFLLLITGKWRGDRMKKEEEEEQKKL